MNTGKDGSEQGSPLREYFNKTFRTAQILNGAMVATLLVYAVVVEVFRSRFSGFWDLGQFDTLRMLRVVLYMIGALEIIVIRIIRGLVLRKTPDQSGRALVQRLFRASIISATPLLAKAASIG